MMNYPLKNNTQFLLIVLSWLCLLVPLKAENSTFTLNSEEMELKVEPVTDDLGIPWGMAFLSSDKLLITERSGSILILDLKKHRKTKLKNTPVVMVDGQGGMLDVALSPDYKTSGWIYFTYVKEVSGKGATVLARAKLEIKNYSLNNWQELLVSKSISDGSYHFTQIFIK